MVTASYIAFLQVFLGGAFAKNQNMCPLLTIVQLSCCAVPVIDKNWNVVKEDGRGILHVPSQFLSMFEQELLSDLQN